MTKIEDWREIRRRSANRNRIAFLATTGSFAVMFGVAAVDAYGVMRNKPWNNLLGVRAVDAQALFEFAAPVAGLAAAAFVAIVLFWRHQPE